MASIPGSVTLGGFIAPTDTEDVYATHDETYGKGGFRSVANSTQRNNIPAPRRVEGMLVYVIDEDITYQLGSDLTTWSVYASGGGGGTVGVLTTGAGIVGAEGGTSMSQNIQIDLDVNDLGAGALTSDENDYVPIHDDSSGSTIKVKVIHITDGGTF